jgi:hypothetical protein
MNRVVVSSLSVCAAAGASIALASAGAVGASARPGPSGVESHRTGTKGHHSNNEGNSAPAPAISRHVFAASGTLTSPDDITSEGGRIFVAWQNGTQPDGSGGGSSTVVAYRNNGKPAGSWDIPGHVDGLTADPANHRVIATVNEDLNSALYTITSSGKKAGKLRHYTYSPDPSTLTGGGTDAVSIVAGKILISASNPQSTTGPAVFHADVPTSGAVATLTPYFNDNSTAVDAITHKPVTLSLTDPDSNAVVPSGASMFGGDFVLDSQGDSQLIFAAGTSAPSLMVLNLNAGSSGGPAPQVDDVRWTT